MPIQITSLSAWIINLERNYERWLGSLAALSNVVSAEKRHRVAAVDGLNFIRHDGSGRAEWNHDAVQQLQAEGLIENPPTLDPVRTAICLSHQRALHEFLASGEEWGLIFEDDIRKGEILTQVLAEEGMIHPPEDAELVFLHDRTEGHIYASSSPPTSECGHLQWRVVHGGLGMEAYAVNIMGARKILASLKPVVMEFDLQLMTFLHGYSRHEEKSRIHQRMAKYGLLKPPNIRAYAPSRPLFQSNEKEPSVKHATLRGVRQPPRSPQEITSKACPEWPDLNPARTLGLATVWFNPANYQSRRENFLRFYEGMQRWGDCLLVVELAFNDEPWQLPEVPNLLRLRSDTVCWQKEALLNHAFEYLARAGFRYFAWLDADILFNTDTWFDLALEVLQKRHICQLCTDIETSFPDRGKKIERGAACGWVQHGQEPLSLPATGYGWAMRSEIWKAAGLFDLNCIGGGDYTMWHGIFANYLSSNKVFWNREPHSSKFHETRAAWARQWSRSIAMEVGYLPDVHIKALPHGTCRRRFYVTRNEILNRHRYNPQAHMERDAEGLLKWTSLASPELRNDVRNYFFDRREDER